MPPWAVPGTWLRLATPAGMALPRRSLPRPWPPACCRAPPGSIRSPPPSSPPPHDVRHTPAWTPRHWSATSRSTCRHGRRPCGGWLPSWRPPGPRILPPEGSGMVSCGRSGAAVGVLETDDVVLAQVAAGLDLDQLQRQLAGIAQAVGDAQRDVGALVLGQQDHLVPAGDLGRAADHHPVLGAVVVHLQA